MANILEEVQRYVADKLNADEQLSGCTFLVENMKDIDYEIKKALGKQGLVGLVMTPKAVYQGKYEDLFLAWQLDELEIDIVENPIINRGQLSSYITGQDAAMRLFDVLCPAVGDSEGQFNPVSYEEGEDSGLIVNKCILKALVYGESQDPPQPTPTLNMYFVKLLDEAPPLSAQPRNGWMWPTDNGFVVWQNGQAHELGVSFDQISSYVESAVSAKADLSDVHGDYIEDADGNKIEADRTFTWREKNSWFVSEMNGGTYTYDPPLECAWGTYTIDNGRSQTQTQMWMSKTPYANNEYFGIGSNLEYVEYYNKVGETFVTETGDTIEEHTDNSITKIGMESCSITRTGEWSDLTAILATLDEIPTKTSQLTNDSGYITSAEVPTPDKIEDLSTNVIYANRTVQYIEEVANWTDIYYPDNPLNWDAENNWWRADLGPSFYMILKYNSDTWTLEFHENIGGEWVVDSDSVQDTQDATTLYFSVTGADHTLNKGVQQIQTTGELVLKSYVDGIVGDINSVLDAINGEEI